MADEIKKVIEVDVSGALESIDELRDEVASAGYSFKSLGEAKKYIDTLRASLIDLDETSEEYQERVEEIDKVQAKLNAAMKATGESAKDAEGSYNALSRQMAELKKQFKATNDEAERDALAKQIVGINDQLKTMDASIGNYQRNVGNYEAAFTKGLAGISKELQALGNPLAIAKNGVIALGNAFKALIANPVGAVIMAIVLAIKALKKGFDQSEEASNRLKKALSAFQPIVNAINNVFTGFANLISKIAENIIPALINALQKAGEWILKILNKLYIVSDETLARYQRSIQAQKEAIKVTQELTEREIALVQKRRDLQVKEAKSEMEVSELRAKAADKEKYTAEERQKFLEQAVAKERELNKEKLALAQEEFDILKAKSKLTANSAADNDALAAAEANLYNVKREYYEKERSLIKELQKTGNELSEADRKRLEEAKRLREEQKKLREEELKKIEEINDRAALSKLSSTDRELEILRRQYEEEKALLEKYGKDTVALTEEYEAKKQEVIAKNGGDKAAEILDRAILSQMSAKDRELEVLRRKYEEEKALLESFEKDTTALTAEYEARKREILLNDDTGGDKVSEIQERVTLSLMNETDRQLTILKKKYEEEKKLLEAHNVDTTNLTEEYNRRVSEVYQKRGEDKIKALEEESSLERDIADKTIQNEFEKSEKLLEIDRNRLEQEKAIYEELFALDDLSAEKKQEYANKLAEINAALVENSYQTKEVQKEQAQDLVNTYSKVAEGIGNLMDNVAQIWQESIKQRVKNGKITEEQGKKEFENTKKLQIAGAIINGLAGIAMAVSTAMSLGPIAGPIMAAVNSALVITTTALQIAKIKSTTFDGGGSVSGAEVSSSAATPTVAAMEYTPNYATNITGESETVDLANAVSEGQKDQRVYVVESDIQEAGRRVEVREEESTF